MVCGLQLGFQNLPLGSVGELDGIALLSKVTVNNSQSYVGIEYRGSLTLAIGWNS